jgi:ribosomal protein L3 glutamine methyltransferase
MTTARRASHKLPRVPTVAELIAEGARAFERAGLAFGHGTGNARDEAAALVFHGLDLDHAQAESVYDLQPAASGAERVRALFAERIERRVPAAYLMRRMWFAGLEFAVDERVIVPRSPFAELIHAGFAPWVDAGHVRSILDIGTGSGCIAVACALAFPEAHVDAVDVSKPALEVARVNVDRHGVGARVRLLQGDVYEPLGDTRYDLIVANPPYVSDVEMERLPAEYRAEPELALRAGADGLDVIRRILADAPRHLTARGALFVEVGDSDERLQQAFPQLPFTWLEFEHGGGGVFVLRAADLPRAGKRRTARQ